MTVFRKTLTIALLCSAGALASPAFAQTNTTSTTTAADPAQQASPADQPSDNNTIVVSANRFAQKVQDVAGVVQAFSGDDLRKSGISDFRNLQTLVPGLNISNQEGNVEVFIRGVGSANNTELGDPAAATYLDGVYLPRPRGIGLMFYDLDRVEVNKGPQGTLYGRNAMAGTLNIITAKPEFDKWGGYAQAEYGNRNSYGGEAALNIPISDNFAARIAGYYINRNFGFENASTDPQASKLRPAGYEENYAGRLSLRWEPTRKLSISIVGDYGRETGTGYPGANIWSAVANTGLTPEALNLRDIVYRGDQGNMLDTLWGIQGKISYDFGSFMAEASGSYRQMDFYQVNAETDGIDYPGRNLTPVTGEDYDNYTNVFWQQRSQSQIYELRLFAKDNQPFRWNLGGFYFNENQQTGYLSLVDKGYWYSGSEYTMPYVNGQSYAFYGDGTYKVTDRFRLIGGLRYTHERKARTGIGGNWALGVYDDDGNNVYTRLGTEGFSPAFLNRPSYDVTGLTTQQQAQFLLDGIQTVGSRDTIVQQIGGIASGTGLSNGYSNVIISSIPGPQQGYTENQFLDFRAGAEFDITKDNMIYAKISSGHKAGGFNDSFPNISSIPATFKPEQLIVFEAGSRNTFDLFGRRSTLNLTGFYYDYTNQVFQQLACIGYDNTGNCSGYSLLNRNIGKSRIYGMELESSFKLPAHYSLDINVAWLDTKITEGTVGDPRSQTYISACNGCTTDINLAGNQLPLASRWNISAKLAQWFQVGRGKLDWQAVVSYRSSYYLTPYNNRDVSLISSVDADGTIHTTTETALQAGFADRQPGFTTINLGLGYSIDNYRLEFWASNLTDVVASMKALVGNQMDIRFLNDARTFGVRGRVTF